jgi:hypothetical protein
MQAETKFNGQPTGNPFDTIVHSLLSFLTERSLDFIMNIWLSNEVPLLPYLRYTLKR